VIDITAGSANPAACSCVQIWTAVTSAVDYDVCILGLEVQNFDEQDLDVHLLQ